MNLRRVGLNFGCINSPTIKFLVLGISVVLLTLEFTWNTMDLTSYEVYPASASASLQADTKDYEIDSLFVALLTNGDASIDHNLVIKSNKSRTNVTLFGAVQNLTLTDYNETKIIYQPTALPNKITVFSQNSPDIHVTYTTSDLVDKQNRNWTFSFSFPDKFLLKMPSQAHIIHMEPPAFLTPTDDQNLWGFGPGNVRVSYVIGPLGTREEAQASIKSLEDAIKETRSNYNGIVLDNTTDLLDNARSNFKQGKYLEAVTTATNALTLLQITGQNFITANDLILQIERDIQNNRNNGYDTSQYEITLSTARNLFQVGDYKDAENVAKQIISQIEMKSDTILRINNNIIIVFLGVIAAAIVFLIFSIIRMRKSSASKRRIADSSKSKYHDSVDSSEDEKVSEGSNVDNRSTKVYNVSPLHFTIPGDSPNDGVEIKHYLEKVVEEVGNVRKNHDQQNEISPLNLSSSEERVINKKLMIEAVFRMKTEKPYLRNDDKELLDFLCEKEGSAFESEIRSKFVLPRTSLWRLIKRLEREELVEVRKIGGQNLIKLRFEVRST